MALSAISSHPIRNCRLHPVSKMFHTHIADLISLKAHLYIGHLSVFTADLISQYRKSFCNSYIKVFRPHPHMHRYLSSNLILVSFTVTYPKYLRNGVKLWNPKSYTLYKFEIWTFRNLQEIRSFCWRYVYISSRR